MPIGIGARGASARRCRLRRGDEFVRVLPLGRSALVSSIRRVAHFAGSPLEQVRLREEVVEGQEPAEVETRLTVEEPQPQEIGVDESDERAERQTQDELLEPPFPPLGAADIARCGLRQEALVEGGLPDRIAVVLLDPYRDRRVRMVFQLVAQPRTCPSSSTCS